MAPTARGARETRRGRPSGTPEERCGPFRPGTAHPTTSPPHASHRRPATGAQPSITRLRPTDSRRPATRLTPYRAVERLRVEMVRLRLSDPARPSPRGAASVRRRRRAAASCTCSPPPRTMTASGSARERRRANAQRGACKPCKPVLGARSGVRGEHLGLPRECFLRDRVDLSTPWTRPELDPPVPHVTEIGIGVDFTYRRCPQRGHANRTRCVAGRPGNVDVECSCRPGARALLLPCTTRRRMRAHDHLRPTIMRHTHS